MKNNILYFITCLMFVTLIACNGNKKHNSDGEIIDPEALRIAYNVYYSDSAAIDNYEIFVTNLLGDNPVNITNSSALEWTYMAIGETIYFVSDRDTCERCVFLYAMDFEGKNVRRITDFMLNDSWMSSRENGNEIILKPKSGSAFYIIDTEGKIKNEIPIELPYFNDPAFSPDGDQIVFRGANKKSKQEPDFADELYLMDSDGGNLRKITSYPDYDKTAPWFAYKSGPPKWHPSGDFISYQSFQKGRYAVYAVSPDGKKQWKLTQVDFQEGYHDWSSDGHWLALELFDKQKENYFIGLMNWDSKELTVVSPSKFNYEQAPGFIELSKYKHE